MADHLKDVGLRSRELQFLEEDLGDLLQYIVSYPRNTVVF